MPIRTISRWEMYTLSSSTRSPSLKRTFSPLSIWSFSIGTSIGWGSFIVTCNSYLQKAGILGTSLGLLAGMAVILVITWNLQYMVREAPDAGGVFAFQKKVNGHDYGFLTGWFVLLGYMAVLWANITSLPLFARFFLGDMFRFGFHYTIFGYEVYLGEALLSICALLLIALLCSRSLKLSQGMMIGAALVFVAGFAVCAAMAMARHGGSGFSYAPMYAGPGPFRQIIRIATISPWAFIGFENVTHFSEEYRFPAKRIRGVLICSVIMTTALYLLVSMLSISAYPPEYSSWLAYIQDMGNLEGLKAVPAFYAAEHYMGGAGVTILLLALFGVILTSLIGNLLALSRLLFAAGREGEAPESLGKLNARGIPSRAIWTVAAISSLIPFLGRTAIGWIVDVTALTASIIYGLASHAVFRHAKRIGRKTEKATGIIGFLLMCVFVLLLLSPNVMHFDAMATESYFLFAAWALLGLAYFRWLISREKHHEHGRSVVVWVILLLLILFSSMMWATRETQSATNEATQRIYQYHQTHRASYRMDEDADFRTFLWNQAEGVHEKNALFSMIAFGMFFLSMAIMINNFRVSRSLERQLDETQHVALTDPLTGVKNRLSYTRTEQTINERIQKGEMEPFALAVCDINGLKMINDTLGHQKGDEYIREGCMRICKIYKHSPVFRMGGDEFAAIMMGEDYDRREELLTAVEDANRAHELEDGKTISIGQADYLPGEDRSLMDVFSRADQLMYYQKQRYKDARQAQEGS